jgi:hypothetical protein
MTEGYRTVTTCSECGRRAELVSHKRDDTTAWAHVNSNLYLDGQHARECGGTLTHVTTPPLPKRDCS